MVRTNGFAKAFHCHTSTKIHKGVLVHEDNTPIAQDVVWSNEFHQEVVCIAMQMHVRIQLGLS